MPHYVHKTGKTIKSQHTTINYSWQRVIEYIIIIHEKIVGIFVGGFSISTWDTNMALADVGIRATKPVATRKFTT